MFTMYWYIQSMHKVGISFSFMEYDITKLFPTNLHDGEIRELFRNVAISWFKCDNF